MSEAQEKEITETGGKIAFVDYLILDDPPYLQAQECTSCGASTSTEEMHALVV